MMKVIGSFPTSDGIEVVDGRSNWEDNVSHKEGDILTDGSLQWKVEKVDRIRSGCFGRPEKRMHSLTLSPINHTNQPAIGSTLTKV